MRMAAAKTDRQRQLEEHRFKLQIQKLNLSELETYLQAGADLMGVMSTITEINKQKELKAAGNSAAERERIEKEYFIKQKKWAIAQILLQGAVASAQVWGGFGTWQTKLVRQIVIAAETSANAALVTATNMKQGGVVPSGYPNDSFPAMLTSGERVIPAAKALPASNFQQGGIQGEVVFIIKDDVLYGILEKKSRKSYSYK